MVEWCPVPDKGRLPEGISQRNGAPKRVVMHISAQRAESCAEASSGVEFLPAPRCASTAGAQPPPARPLRSNNTSVSISPGIDSLVSCTFRTIQILASGSFRDAFCQSHFYHWQFACCCPGREIWICAAYAPKSRELCGVSNVERERLRSNDLELSILISRLVARKRGDEMVGFLWVDTFFWKRNLIMVRW